MEEETSQNFNHSDSGKEIHVSVSVPVPVQANNSSAENLATYINMNMKSTELLANALSSMLTTVIKDFNSKAQDTLRSQDQLASSINRLTQELDQLLEEAPLPFIMQYAAKITVVKTRVLSLNLLLKSIQRRLDNIDRMLSVGLLHERAASESC